MAENTIKTRIQLKNDTEANWRQAVLTSDNSAGTKTTGTSFKPKKGEAIIFFSDDSTHPFSRLKIGDGITDVLSLPFINIPLSSVTDINTLKTLQIAVSDPSVANNATSTSFISTISQNANGEITATKANITTASTSGAGIVQLSDATNSTDTNKAATPNAVKAAYDLANGAIPKNIGSNTGDLIYYDSSKDAKYSKLGIGANNSILKVVSGALSWSALTKGDLGLDNVENTALSTWTGSNNITTVGTISSGTWNGDAIAANKIGELSTAKLTSGILGVSRGGTGLDSIVEDQVLIGGANNSITQRAITSPTSNETFTQYLAQNPAPDNNLIVNLKTLKLAIPPINLSNPISITGNGYQLSYYAPTSKGTLHSVLIAQGTSTNSQGTEPLWLDPTSLAGVDNTGHGGVLFYGRDTTSNNSVKPFKTQWNTLPVEQGGTGVTTFANGQLLVGNTTDGLTTIIKTHEATANTVVVRDSNGDFSTRQITLSSGGYGIISNYDNSNLSSEILTQRRKVIIIDNNGIPTHYGNLAANNLTATIGTIKMSCTDANTDNETPVIQWYKKITVEGTATEYKIGEINWDIINNTGIFKNYYYNNDNVYYEAYKLPNLSATLSANKTYTLLATTDSQLLTQYLENSVLYTSGGFNNVTSIRSNNGALYSNSTGGNLQWGTLPVEQGGTGLTTTTTVNAVVIGSSISATSTMQTVATADGAFYATTTNGVPQFGTLPVAQGGTGQTTIANIRAGKDGNGDTISSTYVKVDGTNAMTGTLNLIPASGEGGQINLNASTEQTTQAGISIDQNDSKFRIFGIASADGTTKTGSGTALVIDPYAKTITGGYDLTGSLTGNVTGNASTATAIQTAGTTAQFYRGDNTWSNILTAELNLTGDLNLYTSSADSPDIVWWYTDKEKEQARIWMGSGDTTKWAPKYRCYDSIGTQLYSGVLVCGDGTGASGTWGISISGDADTVDSWHKDDIRKGCLSFTRNINGTNPSNLNNLNDGMAYNYSSITYWSNAPSEASYGSAIALTSAGAITLGAQFFWDVNHNSTSSTRNLWFRAANNLGWQNDWKQLVYNSGTWGIDISGNAATATMPLGFSSRGTGATWGNTTGTSFTTWNDSTGGSIDFRQDNPSSGKMSIKVDGRFYGNEGNNPACLMNYNNSYWGLGSDPDGGYSGWVRAPASGILTNAKTGSTQGSGSGNIGAIEWRFAGVYADRLFGNATNVVGTVAVGNGGTGATTYSGALTNLKACGHQSNGWGTSASITFKSNCGLALINGWGFGVWFAGTNTIRVVDYYNKTKVEGNASVSTGGYTFARSGSTMTLTVTASSDNSIILIG